MIHGFGFLWKLFLTLKTSGPCKIPLYPSVCLQKKRIHDSSSSLKCHSFICKFLLFSFPRLLSRVYPFTEMGFPAISTLFSSELSVWVLRKFEEKKFSFLCFLLFWVLT